MVYVSQMGYVFKVSDRKWVELLEDISAGREWDISDYGTELGRLHTITDMPAAEADRLLKLEKGE